MPNIDKSAVLEMTGSDLRMDHIRDNLFEVANPLPMKCTHCTFPDVDFVTTPFKLAKKFTAPNEMALADVGNFLVRERIKAILEIVVPNTCDFYPTIQRKGGGPLDWWLAVPRTKLSITAAKDNGPFCSKCGEPKSRSRAMDTAAAALQKFDNHGWDIFKSKEWYCDQTVEDDYNESVKYFKERGEEAPSISDWDIDAPQHPERWTRRMLDVYLFFSVRLEQLLKQLKVKSDLVRRYEFRDVKPSEADESWIREKLQLLSPAGTGSNKKANEQKELKTSKSWFADYLRANASKSRKAIDFEAVEKRYKVKLPTDYKEFVAQVGSKKYKDVMGIEGFNAKILLPNQLDFSDYRCGQLPDDDDNIDGVMFASTDHGDCFLFNVASKAKDYPVYWLDHEQNTVELFANSFSDCIKRFVERT